MLSKWNVCIPTNQKKQQRRRTEEKQIRIVTNTAQISIRATISRVVIKFIYILYLTHFFCSSSFRSMHTHNIQGAYSLHSFSFAGFFSHWVILTAAYYRTKHCAHEMKGRARTHTHTGCMNKMRTKENKKHKPRMREKKSGHQNLSSNNLYGKYVTIYELYFFRLFAIADAPSVFHWSLPVVYRRVGVCVDAYVCCLCISYTLSMATHFSGLSQSERKFITIYWHSPHRPADTYILRYACLRIRWISHQKRFTLYNTANGASHTGHPYA